MPKLKLTAIGTSTGLVIPKEMLARLNVGGDVLRGRDRGWRLSSHALDPEFAGKMERVDDIARRYRNTLRVLAK